MSVKSSNFVIAWPTSSVKNLTFVSDLPESCFNSIVVNKIAMTIASHVD